MNLVKQIRKKHGGQLLAITCTEEILQTSQRRVFHSAGDDTSTLGPLGSAIVKNLWETGLIDYLSLSSRIITIQPKGEFTKELGEAICDSVNKASTKALGLKIQAYFSYEPDAGKLDLRHIGDAGTIFDKKDGVLVFRISDTKAAELVVYPDGLIMGRDGGIETPVSDHDEGFLVTLVDLIEDFICDGCPCDPAICGIVTQIRPWL